MHTILRIVNYILHPLYLPSMATLSYYILAKQTITQDIRYGVLYPIAFISVGTPICIYLLLKKFGVVKDIFLTKLQHRKYPFYIYCALLYYILYKVLPQTESLFLYIFFISLLSSTTWCISMLVIGVKTSMHQMSIGAYTGFIGVLCLQYNHVYSLEIICALIALNGLVASARLYAKAHDYTELLLGSVIGITPILFFYWWYL